MKKSIHCMTSESVDFSRLPLAIQSLLLASEQVGFYNFWYHPDYGLYADAPDATIEDDRIPVTHYEIDRDKAKGFL